MTGLQNQERTIMIHSKRLVLLLLAVYQNYGVVHAADNSDCPLPDLLSGVPSIDEQLEIPLIPACIPSEQTNGLCVFEFLEGSVSYTDNTTNSIAFYNVSEAYCINSTMERKCEAGKWLDDVIFQEVATESFLQDWNIALIVIGVVAFAVGDGIAGGLGTMLAMRSVQLNDKVLGIVMMVVSVVIVLPVAGPVALITFFVLKKTGHDKKAVKMKWWYRLLTVMAVVLKLLGVTVWLVQAGYSATQDFYGEGPLKDEDGMCVAHEPNTEEKRVQDVLVIISHILSLVVLVDMHVKALLVKKGTVSVNSTDFGGKDPKIKDKKPVSNELDEFHKEPLDDPPSSPTPLITSDPTTTSTSLPTATA